MVHSYENMYDKMSKEYLLYDVSQRDFLLEHITKTANVYNPVYTFDDEAIKLILNSDLSKVMQLFKDKFDRLKIGYIHNGDIINMGMINKSVFVKRVNELYDSGKIDNIDGISFFKDSLNKLANPYKADFGNDYTVAIDDKKLTLKTKEMLDFISNGYKKYDFDSIEEINGVSKNEYFYCLKQFIIHSQLLTRYTFEPDSYVFMKQVVYDDLANTDCFNAYKITLDNNLWNTEINDGLIEYVKKDMPQNYTPIQRTIYTYIKLCKVLTYDPEFYANEQKGMIAKAHSDLARLKTITPQNSKIVCYEFNQIFAKFLSSYGINYVVNGGMEYGDGHANLSYRAGDYIVEADSVTSILGGDLFNAKVNNALIGLKCKNKNKQTVKEFNNIMQMVYEDIIENEEVQNYDEALFDEFLDMLDDLCVKEKVDIEQKIKIYKKQSKDINLPDIEKLTYMLRLSKAIFAEEIDANQFEAVVLSKKSIIDGYNIKSMPTIIFSFNKKSFKTDPDKTTYKTLDEKGQLIDISKESIIKGYNYGFLKNITNGRRDVRTIPGISAEEIENVK